MLEHHGSFVVVSTNRVHECTAQLHQAFAEELSFTSALSGRGRSPETFDPSIGSTRGERRQTCISERLGRRACRHAGDGRGHTGACRSTDGCCGLDTELTPEHVFARFDLVERSLGITREGQSLHEQDVGPLIQGIALDHRSGAGLRPCVVAARQCTKGRLAQGRRQLARDPLSFHQQPHLEAGRAADLDPFQELALRDVVRDHTGGQPGRIDHRAVPGLPRDRIAPERVGQTGASAQLGERPPQGPEGVVGSTEQLVDQSLARHRFGGTDQPRQQCPRLVASRTRDVLTVTLEAWVSDQPDHKHVGNLPIKRRGRRRRHRR